MPTWRFRHNKYEVDYYPPTPPLHFIHFVRWSTISVILKNSSFYIYFPVQNEVSNLSWRFLLLDDCLINSTLLPDIPHSGSWAQPGCTFLPSRWSPAIGPAPPTLCSGQPALQTLLWPGPGCALARGLPAAPSCKHPTLFGSDLCLPSPSPRTLPLQKQHI